MARKTVMVSDMSGKEIPEGQHARVRIDYPNDARRGTFEADLLPEEAQRLVPNARKVARRGRTPANAARS